MSIHDGLNHQCSVCGHTSKSRDALRKHLAYRHLIGMSGPVRPRISGNRRKKDDDRLGMGNGESEPTTAHVPFLSDNEEAELVTDPPPDVNI